MEEEVLPTFAERSIYPKAGQMAEMVVEVVMYI
jgi:hypothetical protein